MALDNRPDNRTAICPGTFDPVTYGHLDVIARASAMYDEVVVGVVDIPWRKGSSLFSTEERVRFLENATRELPNTKIEPFSILLVEFAREQGAMTIVKGLRAISDFEYELEMNQLNRMQAPDVESVYLMASAKYSFLSSSGVKELATFGGDLRELVPDEVGRALQERLAR
ncbi:MAG: pantetheine-phosphate adenylyltransferase [Actinomycetota bacterium]|nr:pantetheine-phosphate adenylyltransferase [Actinomycetota bacterium]